MCNETFYVIHVQGNSSSLLSWHTMTDLDLIKVVKPLQAQAASSVEQLSDKYKDLFQGLGKLKNFQVNLHTDKSLPPVAQPHRRVPFHVRKQLEEQLQKDGELEVIARVERRTPQVSLIVIDPKPKSPGKITLCVDMQQANTDIKQE